MDSDIDANAFDNPLPGPGTAHEPVDSMREFVSAPETAETLPNNNNHSLSRIEDLEDCIKFVSLEIFGTEKLRSIQMAALKGCCDPKYNDSKMLLVTRTGYGKSHVMRTLGVLMGGVVIIFVPLLSLSADQMHKMKEANQKHGTVETHHMDEFPTNDEGEKLRALVDRIANLTEETTSTIFLFTSPQFLCKKSNKSLLDALLSAHKRRVLRVVGIDEAHLFVQHSSFRVEIHMLTELFFKMVFSEEDPKSHPVLLAMTATMPNHFIPRLSSLITVSMDKKTLMRPPEAHFMQRNIYMEYYVNCQSAVSSLQRLVDVIQTAIENEEDERVVLVTTLATTAIELERKLCEKLNEKHCDVDVVLVHGQQDKVDKFANMQLFSAKITFEHFRPVVLVTNGAGNTGIDAYNITEMLRAGWAMDLLTVLQERGRLLRGSGTEAEGRVKYLCNIKSLLQCLRLLHDLDSNSRKDGVTSSDDVQNANNSRLGSAIQHAKTTTKETNSNHVDNGVRNRCRRHMAKGKKELLAERKTMLLEVMKFFCLDTGCFHRQAESYLSSGEFKPVNKHDRCNNNCSKCDGSWNKVHRQVNKDMLIRWFQSGDFPATVKTGSNSRSLTDVLWNGKEIWIKKIFDVPQKKTLQKYHAEALMMSLIAAEIITWKVNAGNIEWELKKEDKDGVPTCCYFDDIYWKGIPLFQ